MKISTRVLAISALMSLVVTSNVFANESSVQSANNVEITPFAYIDEVINYTSTTQQKTGIFPWEDLVDTSVYYKTISFPNSYTLTGTTTSYTAATGGPLTYTRKKIVTYNYSIS